MQGIKDRKSPVVKDAKYAKLIIISEFFRKPYLIHTNLMYLEAGSYWYKMQNCYGKMGNEAVDHKRKGTKCTSAPLSKNAVSANITHSRYFY